jgi:hypothetical protein
MPITLGILAQSRQAAVQGDFVLLDQRVLTGTEASVVFSSLNTLAAGYKHLQIRMAARSSFSSTTVGVYSRFNTDTGNNYNGHFLLGNGSNVLSGTTGNVNYALSGLISGASAAADNFGVTVIDLLDFSNTSKNKTTRALGGSTGGNRIDLHSGLWMNTNAVTTWTLLPDAGSWVANTRISLYGVK